MDALICAFLKLRSLCMPPAAAHLLTGHEWSLHASVAQTRPQPRCTPAASLWERLPGTSSSAQPSWPLLLLFQGHCQSPPPKGTSSLPVPHMDAIPQPLPEVCSLPPISRASLLLRPSSPLDLTIALGFLVPGTASLSGLLLGSCQSLRHQNQDLLISIPPGEPTRASDFLEQRSVVRAPWLRRLEEGREWGCTSGWPFSQGPGPELPIRLSEHSDVPQRLSPSSTSPGTGGAASPGPRYIPSLIFAHFPTSHSVFPAHALSFALYACSLRLEKSLPLNKLHLSCKLSLNKSHLFCKDQLWEFLQEDLTWTSRLGNLWFLPLVTVFPPHPAHLFIPLTCTHLLACVCAWRGDLDTGAGPVSCFLSVQHRVGACTCSQGERPRVPGLSPPHDAVSSEDDRGTSEGAGSRVTRACWVLGEPVAGFVSGEVWSEVSFPGDSLVVTSLGTCLQKSSGL